MSDLSKMACTGTRYRSVFHWDEWPTSHHGVVIPANINRWSLILMQSSTATDSRVYPAPLQSFPLGAQPGFNMNIAGFYVELKFRDFPALVTGEWIGISGAIMGTYVIQWIEVVFQG